MKLISIEKFRENEQDDYLFRVHLDGQSAPVQFVAVARELLKWERFLETVLRKTGQALADPTLEHYPSGERNDWWFFLLREVYLRRTWEN